MFTYRVQLLGSVIKMDSRFTLQCFTIAEIATCTFELAHATFTQTLIVRAKFDHLQHKITQAISIQKFTMSDHSIGNQNGVAQRWYSYTFAPVRCTVTRNN